MRPRPLRARLRRAVARTLAAGRHARPGLRVLTYHRVNDEHPRDRLSIPTRAFSEQMQALVRTGRPVVALGSMLPALRGETALPAGAVAITFDDGYADNALAAGPVLASLGLTATFFVVSGRIGGATTIERYQGCCQGDRLLDWDEVRALHAAGHAIGGHGRSHRELATLTLEEARAEVRGCREDIERQLGERPSLFCYPRGSHSPAVRRLLGDEGFASGCTVEPGPNAPGQDLFALRRTEVSADDEIEDLLFKLDGGFDAWHGFLQRARRVRS